MALFCKSIPGRVGGKEIPGQARDDGERARDDGEGPGGRNREGKTEGEPGMTGGGRFRGKPGMTGRGWCAYGYRGWHPCAHRRAGGRSVKCWWAEREVEVDGA